MQKNNYMDIMEKNHMEIPWHDYTENDRNLVSPAPWMSDLCPSNLTVLTEKNVSHNP